MMWKYMTVTAKSDLHQGHNPSKHVSVHAFQFSYLHHLLWKNWSHLEMKRASCHLVVRMFADCRIVTEVLNEPGK